MQFPRSHRRIEGFTLTELLVVIGIIIILIGITLPVIKKVRYAAYTADTQNEINQISNACSQYYTTFHAYPGPFSNDDITGGAGAQMGPTNLSEIYFPPASVTTPFMAQTNDPNAVSPWIVTGAENLVLGLMGGLRPDPSKNPLQMAFAATEVGLGPLSLNPTNPIRTPSFLPNGISFLMWCQLNPGNQNVRTTGIYQNMSGNAAQFSGTPFTDAAGTAASDCPIPVFVDRFPDPGQLPILYLRARTGAKGIVWDNIQVMNDVNTNTPAYYQYDLREIFPYTIPKMPGAVSIGLAAGSQHNLQRLQPPQFVNATGNYYSVSDKSIWPYNAGPYFINTSITPTSTANDAQINSTGRPKEVDQYILISAGPDGIYGTPDDITNFGNP